MNRLSLLIIFLFTTLFWNCSTPDSYHIEEIPICYKDYDFHLGMDFDTVKAKLPDIVIDKNGPNKDNEAIFDFYSISEQTVRVSKTTQMNPTIYATFNEAQQLLGMSIQYLCSCKGQSERIDPIINYAQKVLFPCMETDFKASDLIQTESTENYTASIQLDTSNQVIWKLSYEIKLIPH